MNSTIQVRINQKEKKKVKRVLDDLGLDFSTAVKLYFRQIIERHGIPFQIVTENGFTPEQEKSILAESEETMRLYRAGKIKSYANVKELLADIEKNGA